MMGIYFIIFLLFFSFSKSFSFSFSFFPNVFLMEKCTEEIEAWELVPSTALMDPMLSSQCVASFKP